MGLRMPRNTLDSSTDLCRHDTRPAAHNGCVSIRWEWSDSLIQGHFEGLDLYLRNKQYFYEMKTTPGQGTVRDLDILARRH